MARSVGTDEENEKSPSLCSSSNSNDVKRKRVIRRASIEGGRPKVLLPDAHKEKISRRRSSSDGETPNKILISGIYGKKMARRRASLDEGSFDKLLPPVDVYQVSTDGFKKKMEKRSSTKQDALADNDLSFSDKSKKFYSPKKSAIAMHAVEDSDTHKSKKSNSRKKSDLEISGNGLPDTIRKKKRSSRKLSDVSGTETEDSNTHKSKKPSSLKKLDPEVFGSDITDLDGSKKSTSRKKSSRPKKTEKGLKDSLKLEKKKRSSVHAKESSSESSGEEFDSDRARRLSGVSKASSKTSRDVTFSQSTLVRLEKENSGKVIVEKESIPTVETQFPLEEGDQAVTTSTMARIKARRLGKQQSPPSLAEALASSTPLFNNSNDALSAAMGKLPDSKSGSDGSALRPSRFANKGRISFADESCDNGEPHLNNRSNAENDPLSPVVQTKPSIMKARFASQVNSSSGDLSRNSSSRRPASESEMSNKTSQTRSGVQRKISFTDPAAGNEQVDPERNEGNTSFVSSLVGTITKQHKQLRRSKMSMENQVYVPPKSRRKSIFQAMAHVMAGRTVELVMWTYGASFGKVMLFFLTFYVVNIFVWAGVMDLVDQTTSGGDCIHGDDAASLSGTARYELAFELSWSTFTTVGYGAVSPPGGETGCYAIRLICAFVAFTGVLFGSTTAAIMYSKLMRLLAQAHVTFSSTLCVQYGRGAEGGTVRYGQLNFRASLSVQAYKKLTATLLTEDSQRNGDSADESPAGSEDGYPVIEFRMMNDRANHEGSEIWDAQISAIVQLHKEQTGSSAGALKNDKVSGGGSTLDLEKKVYYPISLTPNTHPHFSRIWYARHVLNEESPLLKREVRDMIAADKKWDPDFNSWREIRDCLNPFISLRVTLSGTSAVSASTVFAEHVYEFDDVCVGWRFANMVYEKKVGIYNRSWWRRFGRPFGLTGEPVQAEGDEDNPDMKTKVDRALLHDIVPQPGGDFEPMEDDTDSVFHIFNI